MDTNLNDNEKHKISDSFFFLIQDTISSIWLPVSLFNPTK